MSRSPQPPKKPPLLSKHDELPPAVRFRKAASIFLRTNLISIVVVFLISSWLVLSYLVYRVEYQAKDANITSYGEGLWWGIVTFLTVGYGDRFPVTAAGRVFAGFLMLAGVMAVGIVTAKISSYFLEQALRQGRGLVDTNRLKDHFIVCGWKEDMHELLSHILDFNPGLTADRVVMIANVSQAHADMIREQPRLKDVQIIVGEYYQDANLRRAAPERARKVLILADRSPNANGQMASMTEVDARTIMTAMTLSNMARGTLVAAEILDPKMDHYLKLAQVSEVIYTREYSRLLLGNASGGTGISNILFDLLDPKTPTVIATHPIPEQFLGRTYTEYRTHIRTEIRHSILLGILENTGNSHTIKELALRQAQKTPDVSRLVANLRSVKELKCNHPVFNPPDDYVILEGSMAIMIENRNYQGSKHDSGKETPFARAA